MRVLWLLPIVAVGASPYRSLRRRLKTSRSEGPLASRRDGSWALGGWSIASLLPDRSVAVGGGDSGGSASTPGWWHSGELCGAGTTWLKTRCVPDRMRVCGDGTTWSETECVPDNGGAKTTAALRSPFAADDAWFDVPTAFVERRRFQREDNSVVRTLESSVDSEYRVDDAQGCGWDLRQRTVVNPPCDGAPVLADCWSWTVVLTTNPKYAETSVCDAESIGTVLWDVGTGLSTGVHMDVSVVGAEAASGSESKPSLLP